MNLYLKGDTTQLRGATAMNAAGRRLPLNLLDSAAHSFALVVNFELKTRLTDWFKFDTCSTAVWRRRAAKVEGYYLVAFIADLNYVVLFTRKDFGTFVTFIPGMILQCQNAMKL